MTWGLRIVAEQLPTLGTCAEAYPPRTWAQEGTPGIGVKVMIQFSCQVAPESKENACRHTGDCGSPTSQR